MPRFNLTWLYFAVIAIMAGFLWFGNSNPGRSSKEVSYSELKQYIAKGYGNEIIVDKGEGQISLAVRPEHIRTVFHQSAEQVGAHPKVRAKYPSADRVDDYLNSIQYKGKVTYDETHNYFMTLLGAVLPILLFAAIWLFALRGMGGAANGIFGVGKSKAKEYTKGEGVNITFKDVAGQEGAKQEVKEIVDFLKNPDKYTELGGKIPKGALLVGPPGTGKTLLAKAVAGEAGVPFFSMSGSDFVEMFVGVGASRVRDLFEKAKEKAPSIVFIDEIDAVGRARSKGASFGGNDERENTLNQLLTEMDGFGTNSGVIILAATNRVDVLDQALLRAGRFDRQIYVDLPDLPERIAIFNVHLRPLKLQPGLDIDLLARQTPGFSGADIANVCNEAALIAARHNREAVTKQDFLDAVDRIIGGLEKKTLAGRAAEEVFLGRISSGALNDLERVTQRAYGMVAYLGMSESLPNLSYYSNQESFQKPYSEETGRRIDAEVSRLINEQYERAKRILTENAAKHNALADLLCEHEVIFAADVTNIFGSRPWKSRAEIIMEEQPPVHHETPADASLTSAEAMPPTADSATETTKSVEESGNTSETSETSSSHPVDAPFSPN